MKKITRTLINRMLLAITDDEWNEICGEVGRLFEHEKITWEDHEMLFKLVNRLWVR